MGAASGEGHGAQPRRFLLGQLRIEAEPLGPIFQRILNMASRHRVRGVSPAARSKGRWWPIAYREPYFHFDRQLERLPAERRFVHLKGYWQSERYFSDIALQIREETLPGDPEILVRCEEAIRRLRRGRPLVSVHVRRGDYLDSRVQQFHILLSRRYYTRAMEAFGKACDFLVFSDDLPWCREHLKAENIRYSPGTSEVEDLTLMRLCDHHVIANSTFSWWGAWLNPNQGKTVMAPKQWFASGYRHLDTSDLLPPDWVRL